MTLDTYNRRSLVHIVGKFYNHLYKDQREIYLCDQRKNLTETEEITPVMTHEVLQAIRFIQKGKCTREDRITIGLIKKAGEEFSKSLSLLFSKFSRNQMYQMIAIM